MQILTKYTLKQLLLNFILILLGLVTLIWLTQSLRMIDMIVTKGVPIRIFLSMTLLILPNFVQILSPIAFFAVILFVYSRMQSDKEIMVMQAIGMSNRQIMKSVLAFALFLTVTGYFLTLHFVPNSFSKLNELKFAVKNDLSHLLLQEGQFNTFKNGFTLYIKQHNSDGSVGGIIAYDSSKKGQSGVLIAEKALVFQEDGGFKLIFNNGTRQEYTAEDNQYSILKFDKYTLFINDSGAGASARNVEAGEYTLKKLLLAKQSDFATPKAYRKAKLEAIKRLTKPLYNFTMAFLAIFAILAPFYNRRGQMGRTNMVILMALLVQSFSLGIESLIAKNLWFTLLLPFNILGPILFVYFSIGQGYKFALRKLLSKKMVFLFLILCLFSSSTQAQVKLNTNIHVDKDKPVDFEADSIAYNDKTNTVIATGNVIIEQNDMTLTTNELVFDKNTNHIHFNQPLRIVLADGTTLDATDSVLTADLKQGIANTINMRLYEGTLITATKMTRKKQGAQVDFKNITYTPCVVCKNKSPSWELSANRLIHKVPEKEMIFKHALLKVKDVPVFYFPYIAIPDFSVKRKTGFLMPTFSHSSEMQQGITTPFFIDINPSNNLTISPTFSPTHAPLVIAKYEGIFQNFALNITGSGTQDKNDDKQGHIRANLVYNVNDKWRVTGQYYRASSDTYFRRYDLPDVNTSAPYLTSHITAERFGHNSYMNFAGYSYQSLLSAKNKDTIPDFIPTASYQYVSNALNDTGIYNFTTLNTALYHNDVDFTSNRASVLTGFTLPYTSDLGFDIQSTASIRLDGYYVSHFNDDSHYSVGRAYPVGSIKVSYPLSKVTDNTTQIIEPIVMLITSPVNGNKSKIPNVDSLDVNFDDTNLFASNRFSGYDQVETGTRANYGVQYMLYGQKNKSMSFLLGQSYRFSGDAVMDSVLGSDSNYSDFVGRWGINYGYLSLNYRFTLDKKNFRPVKSEVGLSAGAEPLRLGIDYTKLNANNSSGSFYQNQEEILFYGQSRLTKNWSLSGFYRYNLEKTATDGGPIEMGAELQYDNDCTSIIFELSKSYTEDGDYEGSTTFMVKFVLKTLGGM